MNEIVSCEKNHDYAESSESVCPECLEIIDCQIIFRENMVFLQKTCDEHGQFEVPIYSDINDFLTAKKNNRQGQKPLEYMGTVNKGCPYDCGLCEKHEQHTCVGIIEINDTCNLNCPVCFADVENSFSLPLDTIKEMIDLYLRCEGKPEVLQISGGEPTLHPDILEILSYAGQKGIEYPVLNTNGIKIAERKFAETVSRTINKNTDPIKRPIIYLQFDGLEDDTYLALRGKPLIELKMKALDNCREFGMDVALVPTIVRGINDHEIGPIIDLALKEKHIKMVNFQPSAITGRYGLDQHNRMTVPEIIEEIEQQTNGKIRKTGFTNIPCPYPTCSSCAYVYDINGRTILLTELLDMDRYMGHFTNRAIADMEFTHDIKKIINAMDSLFSMSAIPGSKKSCTAICDACQGSIPAIGNIIDNVTLISVHAFMDKWNFDLKRARKCCVTEILPDGKMIPFCVYNVLYRKNYSGNDGYISNYM